MIIDKPTIQGVANFEDIPEVDSSIPSTPHQIVTVEYVSGHEIIDGGSPDSVSVVGENIDGGII